MAPTIDTATELRDVLTASFAAFKRGDFDRATTELKHATNLVALAKKQREPELEGVASDVFNALTGLGADRKKARAVVDELPFGKFETMLREGIRRCV